MKSKLTKAKDIKRILHRIPMVNMFKKICKERSIINTQEFVLEDDIEFTGILHLGNGYCINI